jgi:hypothetical protein
MIFYLLHNWKFLNAIFDDNNNNNNNNNKTRTFIVGAISYILIHAFINSDIGSNKIICLFKNYFWYFMLIDVITMSSIYKLFNKQTILNEVKDFVDDKTSNQPPKRIKSNKIDDILDEIPLSNLTSNITNDDINVEKISPIDKITYNSIKDNLKKHIIDEDTDSEKSFNIMDNKKNG